MDFLESKSAIELTAEGLQDPRSLGALLVHRGRQKGLGADLGDHRIERHSRFGSPVSQLLRPARLGSRFLLSRGSSSSRCAKEAMLLLRRRRAVKVGIGSGNSLRSRDGFRKRRFAGVLLMLCLTRRRTGRGRREGSFFGGHDCFVY